MDHNELPCNPQGSGIAGRKEHPVSPDSARQHKLLPRMAFETGERFLWSNLPNRHALVSSETIHYLSGKTFHPGEGATAEARIQTDKTHLLKGMEAGPPSPQVSVASGAYLPTFTRRLSVAAHNIINTMTTLEGSTRFKPNQ